MTRGILYRDPDTGKTIGYRISGHSGYGEAGTDIVCAAISVLSIGCLNTLEKIIGREPEYACNEDGFLQVALPAGLTAEQDHDAQVAFLMLETALAGVAESHPKYFTFTIQKRRNLP